MGVHSHDSEFWRSVINAVALELGILPVLEPKKLNPWIDDAIDPRPIDTMLKQLTPDEQRQVTRRFRKLKRRVLKHARAPWKQSLRMYKETLRDAVADLCHKAAMQEMPEVARSFVDSFGSWSMLDRYFKKHAYERTVEPYRKAARRLRKNDDGGREG